MTRILWQRLDVPGFEWCELTAGPQGRRLTGIVLVGEGRAAHRVDYAIELDRDHRTRRVAITARGPADTALELVADGTGRWRTGDGGMVIDATDDPAALDVDLGFSPVTNSLPIWRLGRRLAVGDVTEIRVAWVLFPSFEIVTGRQRYTRLGERRWEYRSRGFSAPLALTGDGLIEDYAGLWRTVGRSG